MTFNWITTPFAVPPILKQTNEKGERIYHVPSGEEFVSVTTMIDALELKIGINKWRERVGEDVADYISVISKGIGTDVHKIIESYINNDFQSTNDILVDAHFRQVKPLLNNIDNIRATEIPIFSYIMKLAGTCDCIAEYNKKLSVIDFKTSKRHKNVEWINNYFVQATAYALMWEELTGEKIENIIIIISCQDGTVQEFIQNPRNFIKYLQDKLAEYTKIKERR